MNLNGIDKMLDDTIEELVKLKIKENFKTKETHNETTFIVPKEKLIEFCIKLVKLMKEIEGGDYGQTIIDDSKGIDN